MVTRNDVAKHAGVSPTAVSFALNNSGYVSAEKKSLIHKVAKQLGYHPNNVARSLKNKSTKQFVIIVNEIRNEFFSEIAYEMEREAYKLGYVVMMCNAREDMEFINRILEYRVDGVFIYSNRFSSNFANILLDANIPVVIACDTQISSVSKQAMRINIDVRGGINQSIEHLKAKGHERIAYIHSAKYGHDLISTNRVLWFKEALISCGLNVYDDLINYNCTDIFSTRDSVREMILNKAPTAFIAGNDVIAFGIISEIQEMGLSVPNDISVVGFDNIKLSEIFNPNLTTVDIAKEEIGRMVVEMLIRNKAGEQVADVALETKIIIRKSSSFKKEI